MTVSPGDHSLVPIARMQSGGTFEAIRLNSDTLGRELDPFLGVDSFAMAGPTFPPHGHAGFSAVTYVLPESQTSILNRDSLGDRSTIEPGGLHWTAAGEGILHEEVPLDAGRTALGLQIFVDHTAEARLLPASITHLAPGDVPIAVDGGSEVRVVAGHYRGLRSPAPAPTALTIADVTLSSGRAFTWSGGVGEQALFAIPHGAATLGGGDVIVFRAGLAEVRIDASVSSRFTFFAGRPYRQAVHRHGMFAAMSTAADLDRAVERYKQGKLGTLHASAQ